jgi:hypothetical protein
MKTKKTCTFKKLTPGRIERAWMKEVAAGRTNLGFEVWKIRRESAALNVRTEELRVLFAIARMNRADAEGALALAQVCRPAVKPENAASLDRKIRALEARLKALR